MKLKLLCGRSGVAISQNAGDVIDVDDNEGARMIAAGQAEPYHQNPLEQGVERDSLIQAARQPGLVEKAVKKLFGEKAVADE